MENFFDLTFIAGTLFDFINGYAQVFILAFGLYVIYGLFRVINMAHGDMVMLGAYIAASTQAAGFSFFIAVIASSLVLALVAYIMDWSCIRRLPARTPMSTLLATWGFGLVISQGVRLSFGSGGTFAPLPLEGWFDVWGAPLPKYQLLLLVLSLVWLLCAWWLLVRTGIGLRIRACIDNPHLAKLHGINTDRLFSMSFVTGGALAGMAGAFLAPISAVNPTIGSGYSVTSFLVVITGGVGHVLGPLSGSLVVGGSRALINSFLGITAATIGMLMIVALILILRKKDA